MDLGLRGRKALVTGASKGIGRACAEILAEEGCDVALVSRTAADLDAVRAKITGQHNVAVRVFPLDLWDSGNIGGLAAECPDIDLLVDDAGAIPGGNLDAVDEARWRTAWDLKVFGYINMTRRFHALMRAIPWCSRHWPISPGALRSRWCSIGPRHLSLPADQPCHLGYDATPFLDDADAILVLECDVPWVPSLKAPRPGCKIVHLGVDPLFSRCPIRGFACDLAVTAAPELAAALDRHADMAAVVARRARVDKRPARRRRACGRSIWPGPAPASPAPSPKTRSWSTNTP